MNMFFGCKEFFRGYFFIFAFFYNIDILFCLEKDFYVSKDKTIIKKDY